MSDLSVGTHWAECWKDRAHHGCALARIGELEAQVARYESNAYYQSGYHAAQAFFETRVAELETENARLNMEMAAYRHGCTRADAEAIIAVKDALEAEKEARKERRHSTDTRCANVMHKRYALLNCTECSP